MEHEKTFFWGEHGGLQIQGTIRGRQPKTLVRIGTMAPGQRVTLTETCALPGSLGAHGHLQS